MTKEHKYSKKKFDAMIKPFGRSIQTYYPSTGKKYRIVDLPDGWGLPITGWMNGHEMNEYMSNIEDNLTKAYKSLGIAYP